MNTTNVDTGDTSLGVRAYADAFGLGISTVRKYIREGKLDAVKDPATNEWSITCNLDNATPTTIDDNITVLLGEKDRQIKDLKDQLRFLQETLKEKLKSEERLQQIILTQSVPKLNMLQRVKMLFGGNQEVKNV